MCSTPIRRLSDGSPVFKRTELNRSVHVGCHTLEAKKPAASGLFHVLQICYSTGRKPCWISLALIIPFPELRGSFE